MSPPVSFSKAQTSYPLYAATFAHNHPGCLVVGGGGGPGRHGVGNKISVFDVTSRAPNLEPIGEIDLSRDEDSVMNLANLATKDGLIVYAGINSSEEDRLKDKNEHFRTFKVAYPKSRRKSDAARSPSKGSVAKFQFTHKTGLFTPVTSDVAKKDGYQRLLRLSRPKRSTAPSRRIGVIASALAGDENEIVAFHATSDRPQTGDIIQRVSLHKQEANDIDILEPEDGQFKIVYSTDHDIYVLSVSADIGKKKSGSKPHPPEKKYTVPYPDVFEKKGRPRIRCVRWLSPSHILLLANLPNKGGVELLVLRLYGETMGTITLRKRLPRSVSQATDLDVCTLDSDSDGAYQLVIAVSGSDNAIRIYTIDYHGTSKNSLSSFHSYATFNDVHPASITKLAFSSFFSPWIAPPGTKAVKAGPQYLYLASTSFANTLNVDSFTLHPVSKKPRARYVLSSSSSRLLQQSALLVVGAVVIAVVALLIQSLLDPSGTATKSYVPENIRNVVGSLKPPGAMVDEVRAAASNALPDEASVPVARTSHKIRDLLHLHHRKAKEDGQKKALVVHHDPDAESLSTEVHADSSEVVKKHTEAKKWEELSHTEKSWWKERLINAGIWAVEEGETVLKSVFFAQAGGFIGHVAQGVMNG